MKIIIIVSFLFTSICASSAFSSDVEAKAKDPEPPKSKSGPKAKKTPCQEYKEVMNRMVSYLVAPIPNQIVVNPGMLSTTFDPNVKLRVTPVGEFNGYKGVIEYFYGLTIQMGVTSADMTKCTCEGNVVAMQANVHFGVSYPGTAVFPGPWDLTMMGFFTFDESKSLIKSMDVSLLNFGAALDRPNIVSPYSGITYQMELMAQICGISVTGKVGGVTYYPGGGTCATGPLRIWENNLSMSDYDYCMAFLSGQIPSPQSGKALEFGSYNRLNSNTVVCRSTHVLLTITDPVHHCSHVSPAGGGKCVDFSYRSFYENTY